MSKLNKNNVRIDRLRVGGRKNPCQKMCSEKTQETKYTLVD